MESSHTLLTCFSKHCALLSQPRYLTFLRATYENTFERFRMRGRLQAINKTVIEEPTEQQTFQEQEMFATVRF